MTFSRRPRLLTPTATNKDISPYRNVWRSLAFEIGVLGAVCIALFVAFNYLGVNLPVNLRPAVNIAIALLPVGLWYLFSVLAETRVEEPRSRLITTFAVTALIANGIGIPFLEDIIRADQWLPLASSSMRIIGYMLTYGVIQEVLKYTVVRYLTWPDLFRDRLDGVAYCVASAFGYATVVNLHFASESAATPDVVAFHTFNTLVGSIAASIIVGYALSETKFTRPTPFLLAICVAIGAFLNGGLIPIRANLINARFSLFGGSPLYILGFALTAGIIVALSMVMIFFFRTAERKQREAEIRRD